MKTKDQIESGKIDYRFRCKVCNHQVSWMAWNWLPKTKGIDGTMQVVCVPCREVGYEPDGTVIQD